MQMVILSGIVIVLSIFLHVQLEHQTPKLSYIAPLDITIIIKYCVRFAISCVNSLAKVTFLPNTNYNTCTGFPIFVGYSDMKVKLCMHTFCFVFYFIDHKYDEFSLIG